MHKEITFFLKLCAAGLFTLLVGTSWANSELHSESDGQRSAAPPNIRLQTLAQSQAATRSFTRMDPFRGAEAQTRTESSRFVWGGAINSQSTPTQQAASRGTGVNDELRIIRRDFLAGGARITQYQRFVDGLEIYNHRQASLTDASSQAVALSGRASVARAIPAPPSVLRADTRQIQAITVAWRDLTGDSQTPEFDYQRSDGGYRWYTARGYAAERLQRAVRVKQVWYEIDHRLLAASYLELLVTQPDTGESLGFAYVISDDERRILSRTNQVHYQNPVTYRGFWRQGVVGPEPAQGPHGDVLPKLDNEPDRVTFIEQSLVTLNHWAGLSTGDPWLSAEATTTRGNNVHAYTDRVGPDGFNEGDITARQTAQGVFDLSFNATDAANSDGNAQAAALNLFIVNNYLHDWWYDHGFDEVAGNAQLDNYGRGGVEGDPLLAEGQDFSGFNNANMFTPADGASPRMQQFLYNSKDAVNGTAFGLGLIDAGGIDYLTSVQLSAFGPEVFDLTARLALYDDGVATEVDGVAGSPRDACQPAINPSSLEGRVVLIQRGQCLFTEKVLAAQQAGARAAVIANNVDDGTPSPMGGADEAVTIPSVGINFQEGQRLAALLDGESVPELRMFSTNPLKDSSFDNGIIVHEWGHYIQNRLIGNGSGLGNFQGAALGEGWSDFHSLMFLAREAQRQLPGNAMFQVGYGTSTYVENFTTGIRRVAYSPDFDVNPLTFRHILQDAQPLGIAATNNVSPHDAGELWASILWDIYVSLLNRYPFATAGSRMADYLVASYKLTPIDPLYTEARDALLAVMFASSPEDYQAAVAAFARRGMGFGAVAPARYSFLEADASLTESYATRAAAFDVDVELIHDVVRYSLGGYCSRDDILDVGETAALRITVRNTGSDGLSGLRVSVDADDARVMFPAGNYVDLPPIGLFSEVSTESILLSISDSGIGETFAGTVSVASVRSDRGAIAGPDPREFTFVANYGGELRAVVEGQDTATMESLATEFDLSLTRLAGEARKLDELLVGAGRNTQDTGFFQSFHDDIELGEAYFLLPNPSFTADVAAQTLPFNVATDRPLVINFWHFYWLEQDFDGGVIEVKVGDEPWRDATEVGGRFAVGYSGELNELLPGRRVFTGRNGDLTTTAGGPESLDFGLALAGQTVQLRFRVVADFTFAEYGWAIDNLTVSGVDGALFHDLIAGNLQPCDNRPPVILPPLSVAEAIPAETLDLALTAEDLDFDDLSLSVTQRSGPLVTVIRQARTPAGFELMLAATDPGEAVLEITVSDGKFSSTQAYRVVIADDTLSPSVLIPAAVFNRKR